MTLERNDYGYRGKSVAITDGIGRASTIVASGNVTLPDMGVGLATHGPRGGVRAYERMTIDQARALGRGLLEVADELERAAT